MLKKSCRKMIAGVGAAVMMMSAMAVGADAASYKDGSYTATVNFYVPKAQAPQHLFNAYLNDTAVPPTNAATANAEVTIADGEITVDLPIANSNFGIKKLGKADDVDAELGGAKSVECDSHEGTRYTVLHAAIANDSGEKELTYTFSESEFHAKITKKLFNSIEITAYDNNFTVNPVLDIILPSEAIQQ